ncbi:MAG: hypothetical protein AAFZ07_20370 [Actinomycetota bacterium]
MSERLDRMERCGWAPFELDFLRELGFEFHLDLDGAVEVDLPAAIDLEQLASLIGRFGRGIRQGLEHERSMRMRVCMGGPCDGRRHRSGFSEPLLYHLARGRWAVYSRSRHHYNDSRAWFVGEATSKPKARQLWVRYWDESKRTADKEPNRGGDE